MLQFDYKCFPKKISGGGQIAGVEITSGCWQKPTEEIGYPVKAK